MNYSQVEQFIKENADDDDFTGGISIDKINAIEEKLNVKLPNSYKWFLEKYGSGGVYRVNILGHGKATARVVTVTEDYRKYYDLIDGIVVIEYIDEFSYCLDTNRMDDDGECPAILWDNQEGYGRTVARNFLEFLMEDLEESKENWEEDEDWDD
ncbi:SMI1/KNR4 family protein [Bacillus tequilensis]|uniref:SMI1/KNR4 family protein n=1 Tax=Bacillus tequilensis TaxID=227866 RepID=UPI00157512FF|nr:SMI1/KNR4 family protein [Bacillus tequilensis]NTU28075.1 SMI1/KNR4 family protein [Bacillus tequilensis]